MSSPIGILGGTFDPVHHGHLRLAIECLDTLDLAEVRLIPVDTPPHREAPAASPTQRLKMVQLAVEGTNGLVADDREVRRKGVSYTVDTARSLRGEFGPRPLALVMGMDAFQLLHTWRQWTALLDYVHIIVVNRPGSPVEFENREVADLFAARSVPSFAGIAAQPSGAILKVDIPLLDISAARIRGLIGTGRDPRFLLPPPVLDYIRREGLYQNQ
ncbi:MAG: nicotinate-nucleotide adenylyltransferase [Gammaproteobacteria bacterium]|nr:nicotinate-nucleotide adenylyltransferase [Gammaproteobacteria bacterium]